MKKQPNDMDFAKAVFVIFALVIAVFVLKQMNIIYALA